MIFITKSGKKIQVPSDFTYMSLKKFAKDIYEQGRADAIDEFVTMAEEMNITYSHANISDDEKEELAEYMRTSIIKSVKWIAEQLKEQNEC